MKRRAVLAGAGLSLVTAAAGCLDRIPGVGLETSFERVEPEVRVDDSPEVTVDGDGVTARGTVRYGSSECGTVELAHAAYEESQGRLDLLVVAADDSNRIGGCSDDLVETGYRLEATIDADLRRVVVTEHHAFGETYSTTVEP